MTADTPAGMDEAAIDPESDEVWAFAKTIMAHMVDETYGNASGYVLRDDPRNLALSLMRSGYRKPDAARAEVESARAVLAAVAGLSAHYDELADFIQESGVRGTKDGPEYHWYRNATAEIRAALDAAAADPAAATGEGEARDGN